MRIIVVFMFMVLAAFRCESQELWVGKDGAIRNSDIRALTVNESEMFIATRNEVYRSGAAGEKWESVFVLPAAENEIHHIACKGRYLFVGTARGLYRSSDNGGNWQNVFRTIFPEKSNILYIEPSRYGADVILVSTANGVFLSDDNGSRWQDISGILKNKRISCVLCSKDAIYASSDDGVFVREASENDWQRVSVQSAADKPVETGQPAGSDDSEYSEITHASAIALNGPRLYYARDRRISYSDDKGKTWAAVPSSGLSGDVSCILPACQSQKIYCSTSKGVFEFSPDKNKWLELYKGMDKAVAVRSIAFDRESENFIWAVTDRGLYKFEGARFIEECPIDVEKGVKAVSVIFDGEPAFKELQAAAMKFAEVDPDKIKQWRTQARLKALVPKVSVGMDSNTSNSYDIYTSATRSFVMPGPDDTSSGIDIAMSWDLSGIIWSDDQTSIDNRSRLTTQLRNDILDDLRRAYFERKRLQFEVAANPPKDLKARFDKELRIQELTQTLDDLTGNYFTEHVKKP